MKKIWGIIKDVFLSAILLSIILSFITSCYSNDLYKLHDELELSDEVHHPELTNALKLKLSLNDTIFQLSEISNHLASVKMLNGDSLSEEYKSPILVYELQNLLDRSLSLPLMKYYSPDPQHMGYGPSPLDLILGKLGIGELNLLECLNRGEVSVVISATPNPDSYIAHSIDSIPAGKAYLLPPNNKTDVFQTYLRYFEDCTPIDTGTYWIQMSYHNYWWKEYSPPIWTGEIYSDTLWFRVVE